jgi:hypothetical protein
MAADRGPWGSLRTDPTDPTDLIRLIRPISPISSIERSRSVLVVESLANFALLESRSFVRRIMKPV